MSESSLAALAAIAFALGAVGLWETGSLLMFAPAGLVMTYWTMETI